jgi:DNA-binding PadR family transcriptional regulator
MDKVKSILLDALKQAASQPGEQRLYKSGKLDGVFPGRTGANAEAVAQALRDGLLEVVRSETKGRTTVDWVRLTPKGVEFLHSSESPVRAMDELRAALAATRDGVPHWLAEIRQQLQELGARITQEVQAKMHALEALAERVGEGLNRTGPPPQVSAAAASVVPWGQEVLDYLERRRETGVVNHCSLGELYRAVKEKHGELEVKDFHSGLRILHDRQVVRLVPLDSADELEALPEPEYAMLDGPVVYYHVTR